MPSTAPPAGNREENDRHRSVLMSNQPRIINYDPYSTHYHSSVDRNPSFYESSLEHETTVQAAITAHEQFVPDDQLLQSLVAYADSFELDTTVYSIRNAAQPTTSTSVSSWPTITPRRRTQSTTTHLTSIAENESITRHKSCDDLSIAVSITTSSKPTTVIAKEERQSHPSYLRFVPSESHPQFFFATKVNTNHYNDHFDQDQQERHAEETTSAGDNSKVEWMFSPETTNESHKSSTDRFHNYQATTNIGEINMHYLQDLEHMSSMAASMDFSQEGPTSRPSSPVIIRKKSKDFVVKQQVDIQLLRPFTPPPPGPIIIREIRRKASSSHPPITIHQRLENTGHIQLSKTPSPIVFRERPPPRPPRTSSSHPTIVYRQVPSTPPPPTVIMERLRPNVAAVIQKPAPILIERWLPYPPEQKRKVIYERVSPVPTHQKRHASENPKQVIVEYDKVNVIVDKEVKQRKEIKRVHPEEYLQQYGNSLCSNETLSDLLTNITCASQVSDCVLSLSLFHLLRLQVRNEQHSYNNAMLSHQRHFENFSPTFH